MRFLTFSFPVDGLRDLSSEKEPSAMRCALTALMQYGKCILREMPVSTRRRLLRKTLSHAVA